MKKFLVLYLAPTQVLDDWMKKDPKEREAAEQKMQKEWQQWSSTHAKTFDDEDAGVGKTKVVNPQGVSDSRNDVMLYATVEADSHDEAATLYRAKVRQAVSEVEQTLVRLQSTAERNASARTAAEGYRASFDATEARWRGGLASLVELEDARRTALAAENALAGPASSASFASVPYFWSDQYDRKIQFVGRARPHHEMVIVDGSLADRRLTALYRYGNRVVACLAVNQPRALIKYKKLIADCAPWEAALAATAAS